MDHPSLPARKTMEPMPLESVLDLLETDHLPGTAGQLDLLCVRIRELAAMNGEDWVRQNRRKLCEQWAYLMRCGR